MRQRAAAHDEQLKAVVEHAGIRAAGIDNRQQLLDVITKQDTGNMILTGIHPVDIAAQSIDLTVMSEEMIGMGAVPAGECVRGKAGMHQSDGAFHGGITQFGKIFIHLHRHEHAFVNNGPGGETADIPVLVNSGTANLVGCPLVDNIELAVEGLLITTRKRALEEQLPNHRLALPGSISQRRVVGRYVTPAEDFNTFLNQDFFQDMAGAVTFGRFRRGKDHADSVVERCRQSDAKRRTDRTKVAVRHLQKNPGTVSGIRFTAAGAAVVQIDKNLQRLTDDFVGLFPFNVDNEADAAGIVLKLRIVEALLNWWSVFFH